MALTFMQAIAREEGYGPPQNRATRDNNPGNLDFEPWMEEQYGAVLETIPTGYHESPRFAHFPTVDAGWAAMRELLTTDYAGLTIEAALNRWAPPSDGNDTSAYTANVCALCEVTPATILTTELIG